MSSSRHPMDLEKKTLKVKSLKFHKKWHNDLCEQVDSQSWNPIHDIKSDRFGGSVSHF